MATACDGGTEPPPTASVAPVGAVVSAAATTDAPEAGEEAPRAPPLPAPPAATGETAATSAPNPSASPGASSLIAEAAGPLAEPQASAVEQGTGGPQLQGGGAAQPHANALVEGLAAAGKVLLPVQPEEQPVQEAGVCAPQPAQPARPHTIFEHGANAARQVVEGGNSSGDAAAPALDLEQPAMPEEKHPQKPTWRRGYRSSTYHLTEYLLCTLTPSDCSTKRLRPPREWYDSLMGANFARFVVGAQTPDCTPMSFLLKAHAYEYVKSEYYVQGSETKRMFRAIGLQPGDGLKLAVTGKESGIPTVRLTVLPADRNPNAAAILAQAAQQAAKREARLAAQPKLPKGAKAKGKRKKAAHQDSDADEHEEYEWEESEGEIGERRSRQRNPKQYGEDYVVGLEEAWQHAQRNNDDEPMSDYETYSGGQRRRCRPGTGACSRQAAPAWQPPPATTAQVVGTGAAEGRNVLRIKINRPAPAAAAAAAAGPVAATANCRQGDAGGGGHNNAGCPLQFLAGLADDVATPHAQQQQQQQQGPVAAGSSRGGGTADTGAPPEPVVLLSKKLLRDGGGAVDGAALKLGWEPGFRSTVQISRKLSQFGASHHDTAAVETFEVRPAECMVELTLRLQQAAGRVDFLEQAIMQLLDTL